MFLINAILETLHSDEDELWRRIVKAEIYTKQEIEAESKGAKQGTTYVTEMILRFRLSLQLYWSNGFLERRSAVFWQHVFMKTQLRVKIIKGIHICIKSLKRAIEIASHYVQYNRF